MRLLKEVRRRLPAQETLYTSVGRGRLAGNPPGARVPPICKLERALMLDIVLFCAVALAIPSGEAKWKAQEAEEALQAPDSQAHLHSGVMRHSPERPVSAGLNSPQPQGVPLPTPKAAQGPCGIPLLQQQGLISPQQQPLSPLQQEKLRRFSPMQHQESQVLASPPPATPRKPPLYPAEGQQWQQLEQQQPQQLGQHQPQPQQPIRMVLEPLPQPMSQGWQFQQQMPPLVQQQAGPPQAMAVEQDQQWQYLHASNELQLHQATQQTQPALTRAVLPSPRTPLLVLPQCTATPHLEHQQTPMVFVQGQTDQALLLRSPPKPLLVHPPPPPQQQHHLALQHQQQQALQLPLQLPLQQAETRVAAVPSPLKPSVASPGRHDAQHPSPPQMHQVQQQLVKQQEQRQVNQTLQQQRMEQQARHQLPAQASHEMQRIQQQVQQQVQLLPGQLVPIPQAILQPSISPSVGQQVPQGAILYCPGAPAPSQGGCAASAEVTQTVAVPTEPHKSVAGDVGSQGAAKQRTVPGEQQAPLPFAKYHSAQLEKPAQNPKQVQALQQHVQAGAQPQQQRQQRSQQQQQRQEQQDAGPNRPSSPEEIPQETQPAGVPQPQQQQQALVPAKGDAGRRSSTSELQQRGRLLMKKQQREERQQQSSRVVVQPPPRAASVAPGWHPFQRGPIVQRVQLAKDGAVAATAAAQNQQPAVLPPAVEPQPLAAQLAPPLFPISDRATPRSPWNAAAPVQLQQQRPAGWAQPGQLQHQQQLVLHTFAVSSLQQQQQSPLLFTQGGAEAPTKYVLPLPQGHMAQQPTYNAPILQTTVGRLF